MKSRRFTVVALALSFVLLGSRGWATTIGLVPDQGCLSYNGTIFCDNDLSSAGTGLIDPFLRTNGGGSNPVTSGWNTDAGPANTWTQPNDADASQTNAILASSVNTTTIGTTVYWTFLVDVNQQGTSNDSGDLLSLTHLQLYSCPVANYTDLSGCSSFFNLFGGTVTYDLNDRPVVSDTTSVDFDYRNHTGSGAGDILVFIPVNSFPNTGYVALLDGWGSPPGLYADNDGFQEWINIGQPFVCQTCGGGGGVSPVPEPASLLLLGTGLGLVASRMRKSKSKK
jgi:hypothetical protein